MPDFVFGLCELLHITPLRLRKAIAFAMRQKGYLSQHLNWDIAATEARQQLMFMNRDKVIAALRDAAPLYVAAHDAIRKLQCKRGKHPGMNERNLQAR